MAKSNLTISNTAVPFCGYTVEDGYTEAECTTINRDRAKATAQTILAQMGGARALKVMTSANNFSSHSDEGLGGLSFRFKGSRKANYLKVVLAGNDTYSMRFGKVGKTDYDVIAFETDVYFDQLNDVFRRVTGLETLIPRIIGINA